MLITFSGYQKRVDQLHKLSEKDQPCKICNFFLLQCVFWEWIYYCAWHLLCENNDLRVSEEHAPFNYFIQQEAWVYLQNYSTISLFSFLSSIFSKHCYRFQYLHFRLCGRKKKKKGGTTGVLTIPPWSNQQCYSLQFVWLMAAPPTGFV